MNASNPQGGGNTPPATKRRKQSPEQAQAPGLSSWRPTRVCEEEILSFLVAHAVAHLGGDVASNMTLQVNDNGEYRPLGDVLPQGATLQFGTFIKD